MLLVARRAPIQSRPEGEVETGPQIARVSALSGKVMWTPHPAEPFGRAEPSVNLNAEGLSSKGSPGPVDLISTTNLAYPHSFKNLLFTTLF